MKAIIYSDGSYHLTGNTDEIPSDPYNTFDAVEIREWDYCPACGTPIVPSYGEPIANCSCQQHEWYR